MSETVHCRRCGQTAEALPKPPLPGEIGGEIQAHVCPECWAEWRRIEVMVINELRLNFMDPRAQDILDQQMREFFSLAGPGQDDSAEATP